MFVSSLRTTASLWPYCGRFLLRPSYHVLFQELQITVSVVRTLIFRISSLLFNLLDSAVYLEISVSSCNRIWGLAPPFLIFFDYCNDRLQGWNIIIYNWHGAYTRLIVPLVFIIMKGLAHRHLLAHRHSFALLLDNLAERLGSVRVNLLSALLQNFGMLVCLALISLNIKLRKVLSRALSWLLWSALLRDSLRWVGLHDGYVPMHDLIYSLSRDFVHVSRLLNCRCVHNCFFLRVVRNTQIFIRFGINAVFKFNLGALSIDSDVQHRALFIGLAVIRESPIDYFP